MPEDRQPFLLAGLGLAAVAGFQLLQKPKPAPPISCPSGYHEVNGVCVQDPAPSPTPTPAPSGYHVERTGGLGLIVRAGPGTNYASRGVLGDGTGITIECQTTGGSVLGSSIWDKITAPIAGYVSDYYTSTPIYAGYTPGLARCPGAPITPPAPQPVPVPPPGGLPPTGGKGAINDARNLPPGSIVALSCASRAGNAWFIESADAYHSYSPTLFVSIFRVKRKITNDQAWLKLGDPWRGIRIVTPACLAQLANGSDLYYAAARNLGLVWFNGPPLNGVIGTSAGYCA